MIPANPQELKFYVYAYLRADGTPYYIGKGYGRRAFTSHGRWATTPKDLDRIAILEKNITEIWALIRERYYIRWFGRKDVGTGILLNLTDGGDGVAGYSPTDETRRKASIAHKGFYPSAATRKKLSEAHRGLIKSPETCARLSAALMGHSVSQEAREKIRAARLGKHLSDAHKEKLRVAFTGENNPNFGVPLTVEHKEKLRLANLGRKASEETRQKMSAARSGTQSGEKNHFFGKKHTEETKMKMRATRATLRSVA